MIAFPAQDSPPRADRLTGLFAPACVDLFAGLGGFSIGAEQAFVDGGYRDRYIDLMVNHWDVAVGVHEVNHPMTQHLHASVWEVDPNEVLLGRPIVHLHLSPDCTDFSKAKGSTPKRKHIRALADVGLVWAGKRRPLVITLENVEEFQQWGPLLPSGQPDPARRGAEFRRWKAELEALGYVVEHKELVACDYGAPTRRKRLFVIARCDGLPIVWPEKTHGPITTRSMGRTGEARNQDRGAFAKGVANGADLHQRAVCQRTFGGRPEEGSFRHSGTAAARSGSGEEPVQLKPFRTAAECIDWSIPMLSIFATPADAKAWTATINAGRATKDRIGVPRRPLKEKTLQRIARGLDKFVLKAKRPFIVDIQNYGWNGSTSRDVAEPMPTVTAGPKGGGFAAVDVQVAPFVARCAHGDQSTNGAPRWGNNAHAATEPLPTVTASKDYAAVSATLAPYTIPNLGEREGQPPRCASVDQPSPTVTSKGNGARLVAATLQTLNHGGAEHRAQVPAEPLHTVTGANDARALVAAMLSKHYGGVTGQQVDKEIGTITGVDYHALTTAHLMKFRGESPGTAADAPVDTITAGSNTGRPAGAEHAMGVTCAYLSHFYTSNTCGGDGDLNQPAKTITSGGQHAAVTVAMAAPYLAGTGGAAYAGKPKAIDEPANTVMVNDRRAMVAAFLQTYYGNSKEGHAATEPTPTVTGHDRIGLVTVVIEEQTYVVTDIAMRMLTPRELARAQGFDDSYVIDRTSDGQRVSKADQVKLIGNSVPPAFARAIVYENVVRPGLLEEAREAVSA